MQRRTFLALSLTLIGPPKGGHYLLPLRDADYWWPDPENPKWGKLDPDPTVDEIIRNYFVRQPVLWLA